MCGNNRIQCGSRCNAYQKKLAVASHVAWLAQFAPGSCGAACWLRLSVFLLFALSGLVSPGASLVRKGVDLRGGATSCSRVQAFPL